MAAPQVSAAAALLYSLGLRADKVEPALLRAVSPFRPRNANYGNKRITINGRYYYVDLNCAGHSWCGVGTLDLSKIQAMAGAGTISGALIDGGPVIGEGLTVRPDSGWVPRPISPTRWFTYTDEGGETAYPGNHASYATATSRRAETSARKSVS